MSKQNKVNPGQYTQAGRLSPDDAARERRMQAPPVASERSGSGQKAASTGISNRESAEEEQDERERLPADGDRSERADTKADRRDASAGDGENEQSSSKSGSRSGAQKAAESKYVNQPHPASTKVDGAFGRESGD
jgi:hypothetical protein